MQLQLPRSRVLYGARSADPFAHAGGTFTLRASDQRRDLDGRHGHVNIQAIQEGAGQPRAVAFARLVRTPTRQARMAEITTGAWIHRADQQWPGGKARPCAHSGDVDEAVFEWLAQCLQSRAPKLGQLVQEQNAVMSQADLPGAGNVTAADQARLADRMVRRAEGPLA